MKPGMSVTGLGAMGTALAGAFLENGYPSTVWNRSPAKADGLVGKGAICAGIVGDTVSMSPLTIICVLDYKAMPEIARQIDTDDYASGEANLAMQAANDTIIRVSEAQGVSAEIFAPVQALMRQRVTDGFGGDDFASLIELLKTPSAA